MTVLPLNMDFMTSMPLEAKMENCASFDGQAERLVQLLADGRRRRGIFAVDADVRDLKAERGASRLLAERGDLFKIARRDVRLRADPAAADGMDERRSNELADVLAVDAAGRDELDPAERAGQGLHGGQAAIDAGREELHDLEAELHRGHDLCRGHAAGESRRRHCPRTSGRPLRQSRAQR